MYIRVKSTPNSPRKSIQIVKSVRSGPKVRQVIVRHVGVAMDDDELEKMRSLAEYIKSKLSGRTQLSLFTPEQEVRQIMEHRKEPRDPKRLRVNLEEIREQQRLIMGIHDVYGTVYEELGLGLILPPSRYRASNEALFHTVMARIANPESKRASVRRLEEEFGIRLPLQRVYRMMDQLTDERIQRLQELAVNRAQGLLREPLDVLLFDCTTLYFESFVSDELKQPGYSKDNKFKESQVLLALMVTPQGLPVGYEVLPGASFEGHSLLPVLQGLRARHSLRRVICVADRGMLNKDNLEAMEAEGMYYIVGAKLKQLPKRIQEQALNRDNMSSPDALGVSMQEVEYRGNRVLISHSARRAAKDRHDRELAIEKLCAKLKRSGNAKGWLGNRGYQRFLRVEGDAELVVDEEKVQEQERWDGIYGVITNLPDMPAREVMAQYHGLWQVEETFRVTKHDLQVRPMFHWTPRRIKAHIAIAFMTLLCVRHLEYRTRIQQRKMSPEVIRQALVQVQCSVVEDQSTKKRYAIPSSMREVAQKLYAVMGLQKSVTPFELPTKPKRHTV